jgi:hypothetical protein
MSSDTALPGLLSWSGNTGKSMGSAAQLLLRSCDCEDQIETTLARKLAVWAQEFS